VNKSTIDPGISGNFGVAYQFAESNYNNCYNFTRYPAFSKPP